jgi:hypothetical protein
MELLEIKAPTLTTLTVSINVMQVGNKNMTLSVFKQIQSKNINNCNGVVKIFGYVYYKYKYVYIYVYNGNIHKYSSDWQLKYDVSQIFIAT